MVTGQWSSDLIQGDRSVELSSYTWWQVSGALILYMVTGQWSSDLIQGDRSVELWSYSRWQVSGALILFKVTGQWSSDFDCCGAEVNQDSDLTRLVKQIVNTSLISNTFHIKFIAFSFHTKPNVSEQILSCNIYSTFIKCNTQYK